MLLNKGHLLGLYIIHYGTINFIYKENVRVEKFGIDKELMEFGEEMYLTLLTVSLTENFGDVTLLSGGGTGIVYNKPGTIVKAGQRGLEDDIFDIWMGGNRFYVIYLLELLDFRYCLTV